MGHIDNPVLFATTNEEAIVSYNIYMLYRRTDGKNPSFDLSPIAIILSFREELSAECYELQDKLTTVRSKRGTEPILLRVALDTSLENIAVRIGQGLAVLK